MQNDMRDRLVELLDRAFLESDDNYGMPCTGQVADQLIENGVIVPQWISVKDRLPNEDTRVLAYLNIKKLDANTYTYFDTDRLLNGKWVRWNSYVTHWMLLPEPPKAKGERKDQNE